jgi:hypothetical protein
LIFSSFSSVAGMTNSLPISRHRQFNSIEFGGLTCSNEQS